LSEEVTRASMAVSMLMLSVAFMVIIWFCFGFVFSIGRKDTTRAKASTIPKSTVNNGLNISGVL